MVFFSAFNLVTGFSGSGKKGSVEEINAQLISSFKIEEGFDFDLNFLGSDLSMSPSKIFSQGISVDLVLPLILLLGSGVLQFLSAKMMMPAAKIGEAVAEKTKKDKEDDMMSAMRTQSLYMMPAMTILIGCNFSMGLLLYWFITSALMMGQQFLMNKTIKK